MAPADLVLSTMRVRQSVTKQSAKLDAGWGLRNVPVVGGKTGGIPLPRAAMQDLDRYVSQYLPIEVEDIKLDVRLFWSTFG